MSTTTISNTPQVAVVGCGHWGKNLVRNFFQLEKLTMVCETTDVGQELARQIAPSVSIVSDVSEVLTTDVQGIVIATPAETHYAVAREALTAGKDVFVEKPLALTYEQGLALVELARRKKRILMVGHVLEYHPGVVRLLELIRSGELGKVHYIYSNRLRGA